MQGGKQLRVTMSVSSYIQSRCFLWLLHTFVWKKELLDILYCILNTFCAREVGFYFLFISLRKQPNHRHYFSKSLTHKLDSLKLFSRFKIVNITSYLSSLGTEAGRLNEF